MYPGHGNHRHRNVNLKCYSNDDHVQDAGGGGQVARAEDIVLDSSEVCVRNPHWMM